ncbi:cupin domain-containing protein [Flagellimonas pelagia]|uniref:Cupin domain-containing protein n=1 Tax=Flagellimonas pelagia TaxID=2306998 RepID=A0A3A1NFZ1_9FLAO|nr:cupin domain-containing protein [Allomuricauda maritima]RIV41861.1 cupin domain-containing protein [Allomuricauda maritima]TXJ90737.1 cupin domain-containing protein [Allomuricauda maritima]
MKRNIKRALFITGLVGIAFSFLACNYTINNEKVTDMKSNEEELDFIFPKGNLGPKELFTGNAYNIGLVDIDDVYTTAVGNVYFEPGARSNWHTHPSGQILIITDGVGYHQIEGEPIQIIKKGDVIKCPPHTKHWHGASPDTGLQQLYIVPNTENGIVDWMEAVTDVQYNNIK